MSSSDNASAPAAEPEEMDVVAKLAEARRLQSEGSVSEAIEGFAAVLEMRIAEHGDENHLSCAPAYVEYAKALLTKAQAEGDPFGSGVCKKEEPAEAGASSSGGGAAGDDDSGEDAEEGEEGEEGEAEADDLELSFQCFEVARLIYEKESGHDLELAEVLEYLGEVQMENEMWAEAVGEFERSLAIKTKLLAPDDRQLAHLHYQMGTAAVALMENVRQSVTPGPDGEMPPDAPTPEDAAKAEATHRTQAREAYEAAAVVLERKLTAIAGNGKSVATDEQKDLEELLAEVRSKVQEHSQAPPPRAAPAASEGVTTIGFGAPAEGVTTIGFGAPAAPEGVTTIGFGAPSGGGASDSSLKVKNLGVVGGASGKKKAVIAPISTAVSAETGKQPAPTAEAMAPPARKRVRLDEAEVAAAE